jgi:hypothetical protein
MANVRGLGVWIVLLLAAGGLAIAADPDDTAGTTFVASESPEDGTATTVLRPRVSLPAVTTAPPETTTTAPPTTEPPAAPETTETEPTTTVPPTTTAPPPPPPTFTMTPSALPPTADPFELAGTGCPGRWVHLYVDGGQFDNIWYDVATPQPDGSWGFYVMVAPPGTYVMRATCTAADDVPLFEYEPVTFTILA